MLLSDLWVLPGWAQNADDLSKQYTKEAMEQALQTRAQYDVYGIHFDIDKAAIQPGAEPLLDDIAMALKNFPDWNLRIVGHTDSTGDANANIALSLARADAIKAALIERGVAASRLLSAGLGQRNPVATNETAEGKALNRRVELVRFTDSAEAKQLLKGMSDYVAAQNAISFSYDADFEVVTNDGQKLGLASSGTVILNRPDKVRSARSGGFADIESVFDGTTLTLLAKNANGLPIDIPGTVDGLVDGLRDKYGLPFPAADLLMSNPYDALMADVYNSKDLGSGVINGVIAIHLRSARTMWISRFGSLREVSLIRAEWLSLQDWFPADRNTAFRSETGRREPGRWWTILPSRI